MLFGIEKNSVLRHTLIIMYIFGVVSLTGCGRKAPLEHQPVEVEDTESESETAQDEEDKPFILDVLIK